MRIFTRSFPIATFVAFLLSLAGSAAAGGMDPTPERLILQPEVPRNAGTGAPLFACQEVASNPEIVLQNNAGTPNQFPCRPHNAAFRNLVSELGFAIAPTVMRPARTTGYGGFSLSLEATFTKINADGAVNGVKYWEQGTRGATEGDKTFAAKNSSPDSLLQIYSLKARRGLPFGFELGSTIGYMAGTSMWVVGGDVRWAFLEGFRTGPLGYVPDVSVGTGVRTLVGSSKMYVTTLGIDVVASKQITLADSGKLSPFLGYQRLIIFGNSTIVDLTPNVDPLEQCGYQGPDPATGSPVCKNKLSNGRDNNGDYNNNVTFDPVRIHRHRLLVGATYRYELLEVGAQFATDITDPGSENYAITGGGQWTLSLSGGVAF